MNLGLVALRYIQILGISVLKKYYGKAVVLEKSNQYFGIFKLCMPPPPNRWRTEIIYYIFCETAFSRYFANINFHKSSRWKNLANIFLWIKALEN